MDLLLATDRDQLAVSWQEQLAATVSRWRPHLPEIGGAAYAIDEQTAIAVVDDTTTVISEGTWVEFG